MAAKYEIRPIKTPRLRGLILRLAVLLLERRWIAVLLAPLLTRGLGIEEFRAAEIDDTPTFLPIHQCEVCDVGNQAVSEVPQASLCVSGFHFRRVRDFQRAYVTKEKDVTPEVVAERVLRAIEESNDPHGPRPLRAFIACQADDVLRQAQESTTRYRDGKARPLEGVPIAVKDEVDMVPYGTTEGTGFLGKQPAQADSTAVSRLRAAGALLIGKTK